jgi:hypothetical protein
MNSQTLETVWKEQARWSEVANQLKAAIVRARSAALALGILGAFLATLAAQVAPPGATKSSPTLINNVAAATNALPAGQNANSASSGSGLVRVLSGVSVVALAAAAALAVRFSSKQVQNWIRARSVSEALKQEAFLFLTRAKPYADNSPEIPETSLGLHLKDILDKAKDLNVFAATITPKPREIPKIESPQDYVQQRVTGQIENFYLPKARLLGKRLKLFQGAAAALTTAAAVLSGVAGFFQAEWIGSWVAVATTISAALVAHAAAARYQTDVISYFSTANQLTSLRDQFLDAQNQNKADAATYDRFVRQCEEVISIENQGWMANWQKLTDPAPPASP